MESTEFNNIDITDKQKKPRKSLKKVCWDEEKLAEQELDKQLHPKKKIDEPKTPFVDVKDDESEPYLLMLKEVHHIKPEEDTIKKALLDLESKVENLREGEDEEEKKAKFKEKQKKAYAGEFLLTKKLTKELEEEGDEVIKETLENTIFNKYVGKLTKSDDE
mmetsp:Transcript_17021/g.17703  ORF Transcript_17021/g.17703 Transcript_17021/m.17703 type:complete len:162 (+) Transcript_17021:29-514(+)